MKEKYVLLEWPESQEFLGHPDCYDGEDSACFVPEDLVLELESNNKEILEISKMTEQYSSLEEMIRESIRHFLSKKLMNTSEENTLKCYIPISEHDYIYKMWQDSPEGFIYFETDGYEIEKLELDNLPIHILTEICKEVAEL
jgi:hypothetical protein